MRPYSEHECRGRQRDAPDRLLMRILKRSEWTRGNHVYITRFHHQAYFPILTFVGGWQVCFFKMRKEKKSEKKSLSRHHPNLWRKNTCLDAKGVGRARSASGNPQPTYPLFSLFLSRSRSLFLFLSLSLSLFHLPLSIFFPTEHIKTISRCFIGQFTLHVRCTYHT